MRWRIYYDGGDVFTDEDGPPDRAPAVGVLAIAQPPGTGARAEFNCDFYWWHEPLERWVGGDLFGLVDYLQRPGWKRVLFGRTVARSEYDRIVTAALADPIGEA